MYVRASLHLIARRLSLTPPAYKYLQRAANAPLVIAYVCECVCMRASIEARNRGASPATNPSAYSQDVKT